MVRYGYVLTHIWYHVRVYSNRGSLGRFKGILWRIVKGEGRFKRSLWMIVKGEGSNKIVFIS